MFLDYALFLQTYAGRSNHKLQSIETQAYQLSRLMKEAAIESKQGGERGITARSVRKVTGVSWR